MHRLDFLQIQQEQAESPRPSQGLPTQERRREVKMPADKYLDSETRLVGAPQGEAPQGETSPAVVPLPTGTKQPRATRPEHLLQRVVVAEEDAQAQFPLKRFLS